jgi:tripartite-type tricarboxylate transporter receptor subunit TctC
MSSNDNERRAGRRYFALTASFLVLALAVPKADAQADFPSKPVTLVIPFAPGGGTDIVARTVQPKLSELLGQPVLVVNRPGAAGVIATQSVASAPADGHTLLFPWDSHAINLVAPKKLPYDTFKDFSAVTLLVKVPQVMGAFAGLPVSSLMEFVALAKDQRNQLNYASVGLGSSNHLMSENFHALAGIQLVHVPYKGGGPSIVAMVGGEVAYSFLSYASLKGQIEAGRLKALAVAGTKRLEGLPDVPTMAEAGFPGFEAYSWIGVFAPAGTPEPAIGRLNKALVQSLADVEVRRKLAANGVEPVGGAPAELDAFVRSEYEKWGALVREANIRFE